MVDPIVTVLTNHLGQEDIGSIVVIGAGHGEGVSACLASNASNIVLIEPHPALAAGLREGPGTDPRVHVHAVAVAAQEGQAPLHVFNLQPLSSLRAPRDLRQLYPGLREIGEFPVKTVPLGHILDRLPKGEMGRDLLVIDAPGEEGVILTALLAAPERTRFGTILIRGGRSEHYEGSTPLEPLAERLQQAGFRTGPSSDDDPDRPCLSFRLDRLSLERAKTEAARQAQVARLTRQLETLEAEHKKTLAKARDRIVGLEKALEGQASLQSRLTAAEEADARAKARIAELEREVGRQTSQGQQARARLEARLQTLAARHEEALASRAAAQEALEARLADSARTEAESKAKAAEIEATLSAEIAELRQTLRTTHEAAAQAESAAQARQHELQTTEAESKAKAVEIEATLSAEIAELRQTLRTTHEAAAQAESAAQARQHELQTALDQAWADLASRAAAQETLEAQLADSARTEAEVKAKATETEAALRAEAETARQHRAGEEEQLAHLQEEHARLTHRNGQLEEAYSIGQTELAARDAALTQAETANADLAARADKARDDLALALRLQSVAQADLRELQQRHAALGQVKAQQEALLRKLAPRLQEAAQYLHGLAPPATVLSQAEDAALSAPETGKSGKARKAKKSSKTAAEPGQGQTGKRSARRQPQD